MQEIKDEQESSAQSTEKKVKCPNCGHTVFSRTLVEPVEIIETRDMATDVIADEPQFVNEFYCCIKCGSMLDLDRGVGNNAQINSESTNNSMATTHDELARYTACAFELTDTVEVRRLPSGKSTWHQAGELAEAAESLAEENQQKQHIYVGANPRRAQGGTRSKDVACGRCLFVDFDGINPDTARDRWRNAGLSTPTLTINSGHGVHAYWRLAEPITDLSQWTALQKKLIALLDSDRAIHDPARIMRLPGFINHKQPVAVCSIVDDNPARIYDLKSLMPLLNSAVVEPEDSNQSYKPVDFRAPWKMPFHNNLSVVDRAALTAIKWPGATKGQRNCTAFQHAAYLVKNLGLTKEQAWAILRVWNRKNMPPLPEWELLQALRNASIYGRHGVGSKVTQQV